MNPVLQDLLRDQRRRLRRLLRWELAGKLAVAAAAAFWLGLLIDRSLEPSPFVRQLGYAAAGLATLVWVGRTTLVPLFTPVTDAQLAALVERRHPEYKDAMLTAVTLGQRPQESFDPGLLQRTTTSALEALGRVGPPKILSSKPARRWASTAAMGLGSALAFCLLNPEAAATYARRLALSPEPWPRSVVLTLEGFAKEEDGVWRRRIAAGDSVELRVRALLEKGLSNPESVWVRYRFADGPRGDESLARVGDPTTGDEPHQLFRYTLEDIRSPVAMSVRGDDGRIAPIEIALAPRPAVIEATASITAPEYLGGATTPLPLAAIGELTEGVSVALDLKASKPLSSVEAVWEDPVGVEPPIIDHQGGAEAFRVLAPPLAASRRLLISLVDTDGITSGDDYPVWLRVKPDARPSAALRLATVSELVTPDALVTLAAEMSDDNGLANARLELAIDERPVAPRTLPLGPPPVLDAKLAPQIDLLSERFAGGRDAGRLQVGQTLAVTLRVEDLFDLRDEDRSAVSQQLQLNVVTPSTLLAEIEQREVNLRKTFEKTTAEVGRAARAIAVADENAKARRWSTTLGQARQETLAAGAAFEAIYNELRANRIDNSDLLDRVGRQLATPLLDLGNGPLTEASAAADADGPPTPALASATAVAATEMERLLALMKSLETYNEVLAMLRQVIDDQQRVQRDTKRARDKQVRDRLFE